MKLPIIRNVAPVLLVEDLVGVQPMTGEEIEVETVQKIRVHVCDKGCEEGVWVHSFLYGYQKVIECPLYHNQDNVTLCEVRTSSGIMGISLPIASQLMFTQIHNMRYV